MLTILSINNKNRILIVQTCYIHFILLNVIIFLWNIDGTNKRDKNKDRDSQIKIYKDETVIYELHEI